MPRTLNVNQLVAWGVIQGNKIRHPDLSAARIMDTLQHVNRIFIDANRHAEIHFAKLEANLSNIASHYPEWIQLSPDSAGRGNETDCRLDQAEYIEFDPIATDFLHIHVGDLSFTLGKHQQARKNLLRFLDSVMRFQAEKEVPNDLEIYVMMGHADIAGHKEKLIANKFHSSIGNYLTQIRTHSLASRVIYLGPTTTYSINRRRNIETLVSRLTRGWMSDNKIEYLDADIHLATDDYDNHDRWTRATTTERMPVIINHMKQQTRINLRVPLKLDPTTAQQRRITRPRIQAPPRSPTKPGSSRSQDDDGYSSRRSRSRSPRRRRRSKTPPKSQKKRRSPNLKRSRDASSTSDTTSEDDDQDPKPTLASSVVAIPNETKMKK
jgi:hypothetical protein